MKRNMDDVFAAIAAAARETQGRTVAQIDRAGDASTAAARRLVSITLEEYAPYPDADPGDACWRYRKELERCMGGALAVAQGLQAWSLACESEPDELSATERDLAERWVVATQKARAEGMSGLAASHTAWFEVRRVRPDPPRHVAAPVAPAQGDLF